MISPTLFHLLTILLGYGGNQGGYGGGGYGGSGGY
jgi:hypothetical protein